MYTSIGGQHLLAQSSVEHLLPSYSAQGFAFTGPATFNRLPVVNSLAHSLSHFFSRQGSQFRRLRGARFRATLPRLGDFGNNDRNEGDDDGYGMRERRMFDDGGEQNWDSYPRDSGDSGEGEDAGMSYQSASVRDRSGFKAGFKVERGTSSQGSDGRFGRSDNVASRARSPRTERVEGDDNGSFRPPPRRGRGEYRAAMRGGGRGSGRGRGSAPRGDTRGFINMPGEQGNRKWRHPREQQWPLPNPRKVYPSNLRYAPNPVYPKKVPFHSGNCDRPPDARTPNDQEAIWLRDHQSPMHLDIRKQDTLISSSAEEPVKETYLRRLLNARSLDPSPSKSYILEPSEEAKENEKYGLSQPYMRKRTVEPVATAAITNISDDERALRDALKKRRLQTREVLRNYFMEASLSKTYSQAVVDNMPAFVDHILIQAVALKSQERYVTSTFVARAQACVADTKVAEIVKWMKHNHITVPRVGKLVDMKGRDLDTLRERISFLKENFVRGRDLGVVLTKHPVILDRPRKELCDIIQLLEDAGVRRDWIGFVICRSPGVLALSIDELLDTISFFQNLGVTPEHFGPMAFNFPASIGRFSLFEVQAKVAYLRDLGLGDASIGKAIAVRPHLLACDIENGWQPLLKYFKLLGIQEAGIQRIFCVHPSVFCMNLENNIAPKVRFFRAIGVREDALGQVLVDFPALLSYSLDKKIRPVVRFILEEAGVKEEFIGKVIALRPQLIGTSLTLRLQPLVKYLRNQQLRREDIGHMVADFPMLLRYNLAIVESKLRFLKRAMKRPLEDLILFPRYFSYSLEGRIKPRHQILKSNGLVFHLRYMLGCSDEMFDQRVKAALERRTLGMSSDGEIEHETDDEGSVQEHTLSKACVPTDTNTWGPIRGDSAEDEDMVDIEVPSARTEDRLESEEDDADHEVRIENGSHPYNTSNKGLPPELEDDPWFPEGGDSTDEDDIEDEESESFGEEEDDNILSEDDDFLMKYCV